MTERHRLGGQGQGSLHFCLVLVLELGPKRQKVDTQRVLIFRMDDRYPRHLSSLTGLGLAHGGAAGMDVWLVGSV